MKMVKFRGITKSKNKLVKGNWYCAQRPNRIQTIAENLIGDRLTHFVCVVVDKTDKMVKLQN